MELLKKILDVILEYFRSKNLKDQQEIVENEIEQVQIQQLAKTKQELNNAKPKKPKKPKKDDFFNDGDM